MFVSKADNILSLLGSLSRSVGSRTLERPSSHRLLLENHIGKFLLKYLIVKFFSNVGPIWDEPFWLIAGRIVLTSCSAFS